MQSKGISLSDGNSVQVNRNMRAFRAFFEIVFMISTDFGYSKAFQQTLVIWVDHPFL